MLKNIVQMEHKMGDRVFHFLCDNSAPLNEVKDALVKFLQYVGQIEDNVKASQPQSENNSEENQTEKSQES